MQYLDFELYKKICCIESKKEDENKWNDSLYKWLTVLDNNQSKYPKNFISEFKLHHFHDYKLINIELSTDIKKQIYSLKFTLLYQDFFHVLTFENVTEYNFNMYADGFFPCEWLVSEFFPVDKQKHKINILFTDGTVSIIFCKLKYYKFHN